jgi:hypothetical protein
VRKAESGKLKAEMKLGFLKSLLALLGLAFLLATSRAWAAPANTVEVIFDAQALYGLPVTNAQVMVTPLQRGLTNAQGGVILPMPHTMRTGTNGQCRTNLFLPAAYQVQIKTEIPPSTLIYTNVFPGGLSGPVYSADYKSAAVPNAAALGAYTMAQSDGRFERLVNKGVADGYAPLDGNAVVPTNHLPAFVFIQISNLQWQIDQIIAGGGGGSGSSGGLPGGTWLDVDGGYEVVDGGGATEFIDL